MKKKFVGCRFVYASQGATATKTFDKNSIVYLFTTPNNVYEEQKFTLWIDDVLIYTGYTKDFVPSYYSGKYRSSKLLYGVLVPVKKEIKFRNDCTNPGNMHLQMLIYEWEN